MGRLQSIDVCCVERVRLVGPAAGVQPSLRAFDEAGFRASGHALGCITVSAKDEVGSRRLAGLQRASVSTACAFLVDFFWIVRPKLGERGVKFCFRESRSRPGGCGIYLSRLQLPGFNLLVFN